MEMTRTDLAAEARSEYMERYASARGGEIDGVRYAERASGGISVSEIEVIDGRGESAVGRPQGKYVTISLPDTALVGAKEFHRVCRVCAEELSALRRHLAPRARSALLCGIGNGDMTPDAIGPATLRHVLVTRALKEHDGKSFSESGFFDVCAIAPGVSAQTGLDAADIVRAAASAARPDIIIAVDALAARSEERLCRTVQISTAGISPGSGVGRAARAIDQGSMGVPVMCVGVPTVIDVKDVGGQRHGLFLCPKDIDAQTERLSRLLGFSLNLALHKGYPFEEMFF